MEICKIIIESGFFFLSSQAARYPHRRARWGNRIFFSGPTGTDWSVPALRFRDFVKYSQNYFTQIDRLRFWVLPLPLPDEREGDIEWGTEQTLWDNGGGLWPRGPGSGIPPHAEWEGGYYRGTGDGNYPLPPSVAYRYVRSTTLGGRKHYGYLRGAEKRFFPATGVLGGEQLPFFVPQEWLALLHSQLISEPLARSGLGTYHDSGSTIREVVVSHRSGVTSTHEVSGYAQDITLTTARNFSLPVL